jgi:crotonobetainyl-CoA:carnitine CoA-transferase CaiB-like acyl-CoA transferase
VGIPIVDLVTGIHAFSGVLLALQERHSSGRGQLVDCSLLDTAVSLLHPHTASWFANERLPVRTGSAHPTIAPYDTFAARDGVFFLGVGNDRQFRDLVDILGEPGLADDPRFMTNADRVGHRNELTALLADLIVRWDRRDLAAAMLTRGVPSSPVHDLREALTDPQVLHRDMVVEIGEYRGVGIPIKLARTPGSVRTAPHGQGADTRSVLMELGLDVEDIDALSGEDATPPT